jgi:predicted DNA-binding protein
MIRTLISLSEEDKQWLDRRAQEEGRTMTDLVRIAVRQYREQCERQPGAEPTLGQLLEQTSGLWRGGDGLAAQIRAREEWDEEEG